MNTDQQYAKTNKIVEHIEQDWKIALDQCNQILQAQPDHQGALTLRHRLTQTFFPEWHYAMINDEVRNNAYYQAFRKINWTGRTALEIGTGSGLLAMLMVKSGAEHVYSCESNPLIASAAIEIIKRNRFEDKVTVIPKISTRLQVPDDLPEPADILVTETLGADFFNESIMVSIQDAHNRLLVENPKILPASGKLRGFLFSSTHVRKSFKVNEFQGIDLSDFNTFSTYKNFQLCGIDRVPHEVLSNTTSLFEADLERNTVSKIDQVSFKITSSGLCDGLVYWMDITLDSTSSFSSAPYAQEEQQTHWRQCIHFFDEPLEVHSGQTIKVNVIQNDNFIKFTYSDRP